MTKPKRPDHHTHSHWILRAMEWDDPRARYPNLWHDGMPRHVLVFDRVACRLRLGDLVGVYYPTSPRYPDRSDRFLGLCRVAGLRMADRDGFAWIDLAVEHRLAKPRTPSSRPRRVFLCCDPGWPDSEVALFRELFDAATSEGWKPRDEDSDSKPASAPSEPAQPVTTPDSEPTPEPPARETVLQSGAQEQPAPPAAEPPPRMFAGVDYSGDMRDPRDGTWMAIVELRGERLRLQRVHAVGRSGLQSWLRDPDTALMHVEAIGLDFPFGLPVQFAESLLDGPFPDEGWWALVKRLERLSRPDYLVAVQDFRARHGEVPRHTDSLTQTASPLHREARDLSPMCYHGLRMIGEDRSRFAVRPFESAQGKLLLEVRPEAITSRLGLENDCAPREVLGRLADVDSLPVEMEPRWSSICSSQRSALDSVLCARAAARAVLSGETERTPEELAPEHAAAVRREGWIYGLAL